MQQYTARVLTMCLVAGQATIHSCIYMHKYNKHSNIPSSTQQYTAARMPRVSLAVGQVVHQQLLAEQAAQRAEEAKAREAELRRLRTAAKV